MWPVSPGGSLCVCGRQWTQWYECFYPPPSKLPQSFVEGGKIQIIIGIQLRNTETSSCVQLLLSHFPGPPWGNNLACTFTLETSHPRGRDELGPIHPSHHHCTHSWMLWDTACGLRPERVALDVQPTRVMPRFSFNPRSRALTCLARCRPFPLK